MLHSEGGVKIEKGIMDQASNDGQQRPRPNMTLSRLRHDIRNHLNAIKLSCALLHRQTRESELHESIQEVDRAADHINDLITRYLGDSEAPRLISNQAAARSAEAKTGPEPVA